MHSSPHPGITQRINLPIYLLMDPSARHVRPPPAVRVGREREADLGWSYEVTIRRGETESAHEITLGWRDHDYWSGGASAPSRVVQCVVEYVLAHWEGAIPERWDAARARRWLPRIDEELRTTL